MEVGRRWPTITADPPWQFRDEGRRGGTSGKVSKIRDAGPRRNYLTLTLDMILRMPVADLAIPDASLYLWAPNALVLDGTAQAVCRAWGFEPYNLLTWCKAKGLGIGRRFRNTTEQIVAGVRGKPRALLRNLPTHYWWPRSEHSVKPAEFYRAVVERMSPGPYLELFAREPRLGDWSVWGNEVISSPGYVSLPQLQLALIEDDKAPYACLGCRKEYAYNPDPDPDPDPDAYNCPGCGEKLAPKKLIEARLTARAGRIGAP